MFDQVCIWPSIIFFFGITSVLPSVFDHLIALQFPKEDSTFPILIGGNAQDGILWAVDLIHGYIYVVTVFKSDKLHANNINNIRRQNI